MISRHKFGNKVLRPEPPQVVYKPHENLQHPPIPRLLKYEIFAQENFTVEPKSTITLVLKFGVIVRSGLVFCSLNQNLKLKKLSLQNSIIAESVDDIVITIQNNSDVVVTIAVGDSICFVGRNI